MSVRRGEIYTAGPTGRHFLVLSIDALQANTGTCIVVEVGDREYSGTLSMLGTPMQDFDPLPGQFAWCWRLNYMNAARLGELVGRVHADTLERVLAAVKAAIEP